MGNERKKKLRVPTPVWEDPDIDFERAKANEERWKHHEGATGESMRAAYNKAKKLFDA